MTNESVDPLKTLLELTGPRPRVVVAFSGGLDSTVLAHALVAGRRELGDLRLVHIDHGLQAASADWARHCARQARDWRVPFRALRARVSQARGESPEAAAREARYGLLGNELSDGEVLITAHHRDDQVETLLLQLFRGAGVAGLASMPPIARFARGWLARPLLEVTRAQLEAHAGARALTWIDDPSNEADRFSRNFLRRHVLPVLRDRWPGADAAIARSARHMGEAAALLDLLARRDGAAAMDGDGLSVAVLRRLPEARRRNLLRAFIARAGAPLPSTAKMRELVGPLLSARPDAQPGVEWPGASLRRRAGRLELRVESQESADEPPAIAVKSWDWRSNRALRLNASERLELVDDPAGPIDLDRLPAVLELRPRVGGETLRPAARARTRSLKKLLQGAALSIEERARLPLLFGGQGAARKLLLVGERWVDASVRATGDSPRRARCRVRKVGKTGKSDAP